MANRPGERDYRDMHKKGEAPKPSAVDDSYRWWPKEGAECAAAVTANLRFLEGAQTARLKQLARNARLYGGVLMAGTQAAAYARILQNNATADRMTDNAVQSTVDTAVAFVGEEKPRPFFLTAGGNYQQQRKAKKLNKWVDGNFYETKTYDLGIKCFKFATIDGDCFIHVAPNPAKTKLVHEIARAFEMWVDEEEAADGFPRTLTRVRHIDRDVLAAAFPDSKEKILSARVPVKFGSSRTTSDMLPVAESWRLGAEGPDGKLVGGKHCICIVGSDFMLLEPEEYKHPFFPFARMSWCERPLGYWSQGLTEQLQGNQVQLNKELYMQQRSMHLAGQLTVFVKNGSKVVKEHINNEIGNVINYAGDTPPIFHTPQPIHPVFFENPERIKRRMLNLAGMSELAVKGEKPAGLDSGKALREYKDTGSERFRPISRKNDNLYLEVAFLDVMIGQELKSSEVRVPGRGSFEKMSLKDIGSLDGSQFVLQCYPVSRLPKDPAGRLQTVQEYMQAGIYSIRQGRKLLDYQDVDATENMANAQEEILTKILDAMVDEGQYKPPEPTDDLKLAKEMVVQYIQYFRLLELEPERIDMLRAFNEQVDWLIERMLPPPPPMGAPMAAGPEGASPEVPQGVPEQAPASDLLPQAAA